MKRRDTRTLDMFQDWQPPEVAAMLPPEAVRGGTLSTKIARAIGHALSDCPLSREEVAQGMGAYLGQEVSKNMLDAYASQAREEHRIPLDRFIALVEVTGAYGLLGFVAEHFGMVVVPEKYRDLIELHFIEEQMTRLEARKSAGLARWKVGR